MKQNINLNNSNRFFLKNEGFSFVEVLVSVFIFTFAIFQFSQLFIHFKEMTVREKFITIQNDYFNEIRDSFAEISTCTDFLKQSGFSMSQVTSNSALNLSPTTGFTSFPDHPIIGVKQINLQNMALENQSSDLSLDIPSGGGIGGSSTTYSQTYIGDLQFQFNIIDPIYDNAVYFNLLKPLSIPIIIYQPKSSSSSTTSDFVCNTAQSLDSFYVGQICNFYGGTLSDGTHCDFFRLIKPSTPGTDLTLLPSSTSSANKYKRISLNDILCYLDQLTIMATPIPFTKPIPDPKPRTKTQFCKFDQGSSTPTSTHISNDLDFLSNGE